MSASGEVEVARCSFASFKVLWKIEQFCFAVRTNLFNTLSPVFVFHGDEKTSWMLRLNTMQSTGEDGRVEFSLVRQDNASSPDVTLDFQVTVFSRNVKVLEHVDKHTFDGKGEKAVELGTVAAILKELTPLYADTVSVECYMAVHLNNGPKSCNTPSYGLRCLSEDLMSLKDGGKLSDVTVNVKDNAIGAHKAILCRNQCFEDMLNREGPVVSVSDLDYEAVSRFLNLMYSGNVSYVFDYASVHMLKCLDYFKCDILKYYRGIEELTMRTRFHEEPHEFHWVIKSFNTQEVNVPIESPDIKRLNVAITWRLTVTVGETHVSIFAKVIEGNLTPFFCLEFGILDSNKAIVNSKRLIRDRNRCNDMGFREFARKADVFERMLIDDGDLCIIFKVRTSDGTAPNKTVVNRSVSYATPATEPGYENLSLEMKTLLKNENSCDIELKVEGKIFKAHRCVLFARSTAFAEALVSMPPSAHAAMPEPLPVRNIKPDVFEVILEYIYSGVLETVETKLLMQLYVASERLGIASLKKESCDKLKDQEIDVNATDAKSLAEILGGEELVKVIENLSSLTLASSLNV